MLTGVPQSVKLNFQHLSGLIRWHSCARLRFGSHWIQTLDSSRKSDSSCLNMLCLPLHLRE